MATSVLLAFGILWFAAGLLNAHSTMAPGNLLFGVGAVLLSCTAMLVPLPVAMAGSDQRRTKRVLAAVVIIQAVSITAVAVILILLRLPVYIPVATAMILALHLFPLADGQCRIDRLTAGLLLSWSVGCVPLLTRLHGALTGELGSGCIMVAGALMRKLAASTEGVAPGMSPES